jgi:hypothetical protein
MQAVDFYCVFHDPTSASIRPGTKGLRFADIGPAVQHIGDHLAVSIT